MRPLATLAVLALACLAGCAQMPSDVEPGDKELAPGQPGYDTHLQVKYLAAGGVLLRRGPDAILFAPFFSNPSLFRVVFGAVEANHAEIDRFMQPIAGHVRGVKAVLVGHAHYDHLMDLPYIKRKYLPDAKIYGSDTMLYTLEGTKELDKGDLVSVEHEAGNPGAQGAWRSAGPRVRFMALESEHAPILFHVKFAPGAYDHPLQSLPERAHDWREGKTLAYVVEFLDAAGRVDFRVHYQDAASTPALGFPPPFDGRRVDLALLCVPGFDEVEHYPEAIVARIQPRLVVGIHWEDFFAKLPAKPDDDVRPVPTLRADRFKARLARVLPKDAAYRLPRPGAWMVLAP